MIDPNPDVPDQLHSDMAAFYDAAVGAAAHPIESPSARIAGAKRDTRASS